MVKKVEGRSHARRADPGSVCVITAFADDPHDAVDGFDDFLVAVEKRDECQIRHGESETRSHGIPGVIASHNGFQIIGIQNCIGQRQQFLSQVGHDFFAMTSADAFTHHFDIIGPQHNARMVAVAVEFACSAELEEGTHGRYI